MFVRDSLCLFLFNLPELYKFHVIKSFYLQMSSFFFKSIKNIIVVVKQLGYKIATFLIKLTLSGKQ